MHVEHWQLLATVQGMQNPRQGSLQLESKLHRVASSKPSAVVLVPRPA